MLRRLPKMSSPPSQSWLRTGLFAAFGLLLLLVVSSAVQHFFVDFLSHGPLHDREPYWGEILLYVSFLVLGAPAALLFACAIDSVPRGRTEPVPAEVSTTASLVVASLVAVIGAFAIGYWVTHFAWFTDDEQAYLYQAKLYQRGSLSGRVMEPLVLLQHPFVVTVAPRADGPHWTGVYPVLQPALMALSAKLGNIHLSQLVCVGLIVYHTGRLASSLFVSARVGVIAAWLCAFSPMLLGLGATYHTSILATTLSIFALRLVLALLGEWRWTTGLGLGLTTGSIFLARPMEGTLCVLLVGGFLIVHWVQRGASGMPTRLRWLRDLVPLLGYGLGGLVPLGVFMCVNYKHTGHPFHSAYNILEQVIGGFFGFGDDKMWGRSHTPALALRQTLGALVRMNAWLFGWPSSLALWFLALRSPFRTRAGLLLFGLSAVQLCAYMPLAFGSVHDFGSAYHVWHLPWVACISAHVIERLSERRWRLFSRRSPPVKALALGMTLAGLVAFWPLQVARWRAVSDIILGPVRAAEAATRGQKAIVLWSYYLPPAPLRSWVHYPPAPDPSDRIIWARYIPDELPALLKAYPDRHIYGFGWEDERALVVSLDASAAAFVAAISGTTDDGIAPAEASVGSASAQPRPLLEKTTEASPSVSPPDGATPP